MQQTRKKSKANRNLKMRAIFFFLAPFLLLCSLEVMHLTYPDAAWYFFQSDFWWLKLIVSYLFLLGWQSFFYGVTQNSFVANLLNTVLMFMIGYTSEVMGRVNGNPLLPCDLLLMSNAGEIASFIQIPFFISAVISVIINLGSLSVHLMIIKAHPIKWRWYQRLLFLALAVLVFLGVNNTLCYDKDFRYRTLAKMGVNISAFNPIEDYQANGTVLTFFPRIGDLVVPRPSEYQEASIKSFRPIYEQKIPELSPTKANVIIIQNEAWWDPSMMPEVSYSTDLISGVRSLSKNTVKGTFLSPVFSGGTCMPEFEVITGIPTYLLPSASYPYSQYITDHTASIVSAYKNQGYQTIALHPYKTNFYNRSTAYPLLGFDNFKGIDDFLYQDKSGAYVDDMACVKQIIHEFENKTSDYIFEFVVTMENHGAYKLPRYLNFDFEMEAPTLSPEDYDDLLRYSQGVYNADKAFMALVDYFKAVKEPVILVMYGDHLPLLGTNGSTYMDAGFVEPSETFTPGDHPQLYETPYVVWTNYPIPDFDLQPKVSGNTLGLKIFLKSGNETPWYLMMLDEFSDSYPATVNTGIYTEEMEKTDSIRPADQSMLENVELLIYDILHGNQFCIE